MKANRKKLMLAMARACMDTEDLQKAAEMPRPTLNNAICGKSVSASSIRCLYQIAFSGRLLPKQKPEQHKDSTLVMLQHIEDPEAWEKIYKLVNVLWLKEATYRTVELEKGVKKA